MLSDLNASERMLLLKFVCSFAWADLEIRSSERKMVHRLVKKLKLNAEESDQVEEWLKTPPKPEEVDPNRVPRAHRKLFLDAARRMVAADGEIDQAEKENLELFEALLR
ncbi:MAG: TerB family tellurite resistance protein [Polyangiaceae bacterium]